MNNGLLMWPEGRVAPPPNIFGAPTRRTVFTQRPVVDGAGIATTSDAVGGTNMVVNLPAVYAAGDLVVVAIKLSANNTPGTPAGWTALQLGAQGSQGNGTYARIMDGTEGATLTITSAASATFAAIAVRVMHPGTWATSVGNSASGSTPVINGINMYPGFAAGGRLESVGLIVLTALGTITLNGGGGTGSVAASGIVNTLESNVSTYTHFAEAVQGSMRAIVMWANMPTVAIAGFSGVGTWTNFTAVQVTVPAPRRPMAVRR